MSNKITRKELESLEDKYKLIHHSQEREKDSIIDYYDLWEYPLARWEIEYKHKTNEITGCLYMFKKSIEVKFEGRLFELNDIKFIMDRCLQA